MIQVIPAIDIKGGKVVRLTQGRPSDETIYFDSPLEVAQNLASFGVGLIHIVDLDGALKGRPKNLAIIKRIAKSIKPKVELGGGIRDEATIKKVLDSGVEKVVIGTKALDEKFLKRVAGLFKERIVVGIDAREGIVHTKGWQDKTTVKAIDLAKEIECSGIKRINYTDISRDGMLEGPNIDSLRELLKATSLDVIAAGGISNIDDLKQLKLLEGDGLRGVIIGKALYENKIDLGEAIEVCSQKG